MEREIIMAPQKYNPTRNILGFISVFLCFTAAQAFAKQQEPGLTRITIAFQQWVGCGLFYLAEVKLANGRISQKPDAPKFLNHTLLERLYENSQ